MLEIVALVSGVAATVLLLGREYREIIRLSPQSPPPETLFDQRASSIGTVVPKGEGSHHDLWVQIGGELWKAEAIGPDPPPGSRVEVLSSQGSLVSVRLAESEPERPSRGAAPYLTPGRKLGLVLWVASASACWAAVGSPMYALVGVPLLWFVAWVALSGFDFG